MIHPTFSRDLEEYTTLVKRESEWQKCISCAYCSKVTLVSEAGGIEELAEVCHCNCGDAQLCHLGECFGEDFDYDKEKVLLNQFAFPVECVYKSCEGHFLKEINPDEINQDMTPTQKKWECKYCDSFREVTNIWAHGNEYVLCSCDCAAAQYAMIRCNTKITKNSPGPWDGKKYVYPSELVRHFCKGEYFEPSSGLFSEVEEE